MSIYIIDCETTGLMEPIQPIEFAWLKFDFNSLLVLRESNKRFKPDKPIELGALATSHILEKELRMCPSWTECKLPEDAVYVIGHNVDYDWKVLGQPNVKRICTKALSRYLIEGLDSYSQSSMMYYFLHDSAKPLLKNAHSALCDVQNCFILLKHLIMIASKGFEISNIEDVYSLSEIARIPKFVEFGKYKGKRYDEMDSSYVSWWINKSDTKPDMYQMKALQLAGFNV